MAIHKVDWDIFFASFGRMDLLLWFIALPVYVLANIFRAFRWHIILLPNLKTSFKSLFQYIMIGRNVNNFLSTGTGEFYRSYLIYKRDGLPYTGSLASIMVERVFDGMVLVCVLVGVLWFIDIDNAIFSGIRNIVLFIFPLAAVLIVLFINFPQQFIKFFTPMINRLPPKISSLVLKGMGDFISGLAVLKVPYVFWGTLILSFAIWFLEIMFYYILFESFGIEPQIWWAAITIVVVSMMVVLPSAPGYIGVYHWAVVFALGICSISESKALATAVVLNITDLGVTFVLGFWFMLKIGHKLPDTKLVEEFASGNVDEKKI